MPRPLLSFVGDDFTGSTDAVEVLELAGVRTVLFTRPPTPEQLQQHPDVHAFGVATVARSLSPDAMASLLRPTFSTIRELGAPFLHYKVCSTFDSSPSIGSIGRALDVGVEVCRTACVPVVVGAPSLGRYCAFGNLFVRNRNDTEPLRLDRHPSMSRHPVTPMHEADLRLHLARQTNAKIGLFDVTQFDGGRESQRAAYAAIRATHDAVLIDLVHERDLAAVGALLVGDRATHGTTFVVGSSGVESALCAYWSESGAIAPASAAAAREVVPCLDPILVVCGSCSPVALRQVQCAVDHGFSAVEASTEPSRLDEAVSRVVASLASGKDVALHTGGTRDGPATILQEAAVGGALGQIVRRVLEQRPVRRVVIAGGDTSGAVASTLGVESMRLAATLVRGAPLMRVTAPGSPADGIEMVFKGGQVGATDFFIRAAGR